MTKGIPRTLKNVKNANAVRHIKIAKTMTVSAVSAAVGFGTTVIGDFLPGNASFLGAVAYIQISGSGIDPNLTATWEGDFSIGTTPTADVTLSGTDVDIIGSTALPAAVAEIGTRVRATNATPAIFDNTDGSLEINLNVLVDAAHIVDDQTVTLTVRGDLFINYVILGDD
jgi:hypothetical protein